MRIGTKMNLAFIGIILLFLISSVISFSSSQKVEKNVNEILDYRLEQISIINEIRFGIGMQGKAIRAIITDSSNEKREELKYYAEYVDEQITKMDELSNSPEMKAYVDEMKTSNELFNELGVQFLALVDAKDLVNGVKLVDGEITAANKAILTAADQMLDYQNKHLDILNKQTHDSLTTTTTVTIISLFICLLIIIFLMIMIRKVFIRPLQKMVEFTNRLADGDLSFDDIQVISKDEIGDLATANNKMKDNLRSLISQVQANTQHLSASSEELLASFQEIGFQSEIMSNRVINSVNTSSTIAHSANESALAMEETAAGVQRIAESTQILLENSVQTHQTANDGGQIIEQATEQMHNINESSKLMNGLVQKLTKQTEQIEKITKVITDITEQTNLLALNAAIEAARAGEHGKGFAVVADEVRKLAEESKSSANQIVELIKEIKVDTYNVEKAAGESLHSVNEGVAIIQNAGTAFNGIIEAVNRMTTQIQEISATSEQLSASAEEVSASVTDIASNSSVASSHVDAVSADITIQMEAMNQVSEVASDLATQAQNLQEEIQKFKVGK